MTVELRTLRAGDHGADVTVLQTRLTATGVPVARTGFYDPATEAAVRQFQRSAGLVVDGVAGPRTQRALAGRPDPRALSQADIASAADQLGVEVAALQAVIEVESPQGGFLADGRVVILFERHVFWQRLVAAGIAPAALNASTSVLSQQRGGYLGGAAEYMRLSQATAFALEPAMEACSWGRFQIMGYHAPALGFASASSMAAAFAVSEAEHLRAFVRFVQADAELLKALRGRRWAVFARRYNGPAYADHLYDAKLVRAYARHAAVMA